ncbi:DoxX family protein [Flagellimonas sp.]|uniref:DoxX family protein n=1 Tax=Flagellimonas sp. TaxID=2058762 RepID=UPI003F4A6B84
MSGLQKYADIFIRFPVGFHLIYGTQDNIFSWTRMLEFRDFLKDLDVPFALWAAHLSVYAQFLAGIAFILGYKTKWAAVLMIINFVIAIYLVH